MKNIIVILLSVSLLTQFGILITLQNISKTEPSPLGAMEVNLIKPTKGATVTSVLVSTATTTKLRDVNIGRQELIMQNNSDYGVCMMFGTDTSSFYYEQGICLNPNGGTYDMNEQFHWLGEVWAIATSSTATVSIFEY